MATSTSPTGKPADEAQEGVAPAPEPAVHDQPAPLSVPAPVQAPVPTVPTGAPEQPREHINAWATTALPSRANEMDLMRAYVHLETIAGHVFDTAASFEEGYAAFRDAPA